ncbi:MULTISPECIES: anthranilate synthase component II [Halomonadaceae]|jgi:anthranilate synthase component 2|uniref:Anthranilate synthase component 2 n=1 Tax=Vreelandella aquamarina TaxID=77097 RepID=A0A1N6D245_9GAMM|nr:MULTISPECIES: aminodeoxychorismate/anthranilate synthase component II [Halomonas]MEC8901854.1 aminodeoxychorismate/anthranilate synthase component II [Pseudomonadota bacterium]HAO01270.1 aminodeoxychorismate/anthranilate synthase component II [Halomonas sp.]MCC4286873.1 aminodeoxychorismate/anthranilate synthase component II [Halomonas meridiana]MCC4290035.1 aminodeoxychorismate/anthranilate synthase component II [Halomonas axialensis]MCD1651064.1 aminodeoxychorismate/anthranilate synthase |tara:strand:- start:99 stop:773 length:675 start_codon:yes stop_codon:yes gene_type:complete
MKVLIIDNYDSFTYNLYQFIGEILTTEKNRGELPHFEIMVKRNNQIDFKAIEAMAPDRIIISPGPGSPDDPRYFGVCAEVIEKLGKTTPLLGVCLGMQGIVHVFGGKVVKAPLPMHGKISPINHNNQSVFNGVPDQLEVMRYHSLIADAATLPECLEVTATVGALTADNFAERGRWQAAGEFELMGVKHRDYPIHGIQFHPESFATEGGKELIANFLFAPNAVA